MQENLVIYNALQQHSIICLHRRAIIVNTIDKSLFNEGTSLVSIS
jgi:hypothetical protein